MNDHAIRHLTSDFGHLRANGGQHHLGRTIGFVFGGERGCHQRVPVILANKLKCITFVPVRPNSAHGQHQLFHLCCGGTPLHRKALGYVGFDL